MPKSLAAYIQELATKAGVEATDQKLKELVTNPAIDLSKIEIPDDLLMKLESNIHSLDSAKAKLKSTLFAEAYNGLDTELERTMDELQLDDATKIELKSEKSSTKRAALLAKKIQKLESEKSKAAPADKKELQDEINRLKQSMSDITKSKADEIAATKSAYENQITDLMYDNLVAGYNLVVPEGFTKQDMILLAKNKLNEARTANELRIVRENGQLKLVTKDGTDYFDKTQTKKDLNSFTESTLAQHKLLKTNDSAGNSSGNQSTKIIPGASAMKPSDAQYLSKLDAEIAEMTSAQ